MHEAAEVAEGLALRWCWRRSELDRPAELLDCIGFVREQMPGETETVIDNVAWSLWTGSPK